MNAALANSLPATTRVLQSKAPLLVAVLLVVALGLAVAKLVWLLVPQPAWQAAPVTAQTAGSTQTGIDMNALVAAHLFGKIAAAPVEVARTEVTDAPDTNLNLTLKGIFAADDPARSVAMIESRRGEEKPYRVGDEIARGTKIHEIYSDRVILDRGGRFETLRLNKDDDSPTRSRSPTRVAAAPRSAAPSGGSARTVEATPTLRNIRQELLSDPSKASQYLRVQPAMNGGELRGYRIYPGRNRSLFNEAGLRSGDLVTSVNGVSMTDPSQAIQMLGTLSQATSLTVTVVRGGQTQTLNLSL